MIAVANTTYGAAVLHPPRYRIETKPGGTFRVTSDLCAIGNMTAADARLALALCNDPTPENINRFATGDHP